MKSAVTVSLVPEARGGPFVFWGDLAAACRDAAALGFDGIEIFAPSPAALAPDSIGTLLEAHRLKLAAVGTGAGWVLHKLTLCAAAADERAKARQYIRGMIDAGARFGAPAIVGSMQGRWGEAVPREQAIQYLAESLDDLGDHAHSLGVPLLLEPLNRYETNVANTLADGVSIVRSLRTDNVKLLADLFHMNVEETDLAAALLKAADAVGHVHLADSNRRPAGNGHTNFTPIAAALRELGYDGYLSAECLPWPDPVKAAGQTMHAFRRWFH